MPAITLSPLRPDDREAWLVLAGGYKHFYNTPTSDRDFEVTWQRLLGGSIHGVGAHLDGTLVGIVHYLFHQNVWLHDVCYLQDLFVSEYARGRGIGRALIALVVSEARQRGASRVHWHTHERNATARALYDKVASCSGFIRYDIPLS